MNKRLKLGLMFLLLCLMGWQSSVTAAIEIPIQDAGANASSIDRTDNRPQWQDVGMCDVLAITGGSTLTPPSTVRVVHDGPAGTTPTAQAAQALQYNVQRLLAYSHRRIVSGYIYMIRCLRL